MNIFQILSVLVDVWTYWRHLSLLSGGLDLLWVQMSRPQPLLDGEDATTSINLGNLNPHEIKAYKYIDA